MIPPWSQACIYWKKSVIWRHHFHFFYDSVIFSPERLKRSICQGHCVYFTALVTTIRYNKRSGVDSRKIEEYVSGKPFQENHCGPALLKVPIYSTKLVAIPLFKKYRVKCLKALTDIPFFHGECVNLTISQQRLQIFIKYRKCFRRTSVDISAFKGEFRKSYFLLIWQFHNSNCNYSLSIVNTFARVTFGTVLFFQGFWEQLLLRGPTWNTEFF